MADPRFFTNCGPFSLVQIIEATGVSLQRGDDSATYDDVAPLDCAQHTQISFFDNTKYLDQFKDSQAGACFVRAKYADVAPKGMALLISDDPYRAYAVAAQMFYPATVTTPSISEHAHIAASASIGKHTHIEAGAVIGEHAQIGEHCVIRANATIADGVQIGSHVSIGANASISHAIIGNHVMIYRNASIGQDGFGFAMGRAGHLKVPQLGRVIIEDDVEIGANTCIDRGAGPDTIIRKGVRIDNLVQIGHNVQLGQASVIVSQCGISGSTVVETGVIMGGQTGVAGHLTIGAGAQLAGRTAVSRSLEGGQSYGGSPAVPIKDWHRQAIALNRLIRKKQAES